MLASYGNRAQHAANAPKSVARPSQTGQVKRVSDVITGDQTRSWAPGVKGLGKLVSGESAGTIRSRPGQSGGGGNQTGTPQSTGGGARGSGKITGPEIRCQTGCDKCDCPDSGCPSGKCPRLQYGVENGSDNVDFTITVKTPENFKAKETATLQVGGASHHSGYDTLGYKGYIGINGGKHGFEIEKGTGKSYLGLFGSCSNKDDLVPGQQYTLRMTKKNVGPNVQLNTYVNNKPHCSVLDTKARWLKRQGDVVKCGPIDQLRIDNWPEAPGTNTKYALSVSSPYLG